MKITFKDILWLIQFELLVLMILLIEYRKAWLVVTILALSSIIVDRIIEKRESKKIQKEIKKKMEEMTKNV